MPSPRDFVSPFTMRQIGPGGAGLGHDPGAPARLPSFVWTERDEWLRWKDVPPPIHIPFDKAEEVTIGALAVRQVIVEYELEDGQLGVLRFFGNQTANPSDTAFITFAVTVNGHPIPGYANIIGSKGPVNFPDPLEWCLRGRDIIQVVATNSLAAAIGGVGARIKGWSWPIIKPAEPQS